MRNLWTLGVALAGALGVSLGASPGARAENLVVEPTALIEWKAVFGQVESRNQLPARARIAGTVVTLDVTEGDRVTAGQPIAVVEDDKLEFQIAALDAQLEAQAAQLETARAELTRGEQLIRRGVITAQRLEALQTEVDVIAGQIRSMESEKRVLRQQIDEGSVLSPADGVVLTVPISRGSVVNPGETLAVVAGGGVFLRLAVPERHAGELQEGAEIQIGSSGDGAGTQSGRLVKLYPLIEGGRVQADVEVEGLDGRFVGKRIPVRLPVGERPALLVPETALSREGGLDFLTVLRDGAPRHRTVVPGAETRRDGQVWREILTGLEPGETVVLGHE